MRNSTTNLGPDAIDQALDLIIALEREETCAGRHDLGARLRDLIAGDPGPLGWCGLCERRPATIAADHNHAGGAEEVLLGQNACATCYRECWELGGVARRDSAHANAGPHATGAAVGSSPASDRYTYGG